MSNQPGTLYIVATPIGNLEDLTLRARQVLADVHLIAAEDTRHSRKLLERYGIRTPVRSCHEHNETRAAADILEQLAGGRDVALITDAGTPLISDPGAYLVSAAHDRGITVVPVPGPSALVAALSACGIATGRVAFEGFAPARGAARRKWLRSIAAEPRTLVLFEAPHRIQGLLEDCVEILGPERPAAVARELTKIHETVRRGTLASLAAWVAADAAQRKGEFVVVIAAAPGQAAAAAEAPEAGPVLQALLRYLSVRDAAACAADILGANRNDLYALALKLKKPDS